MRCARCGVRTATHFSDSAVPFARFSPACDNMVALFRKNRRMTRHTFADLIHRSVPESADPFLPANHSFKIRGKIVLVSYLAIAAAHLDADALKE